MPVPRLFSGSHGLTARFQMRRSSIRPGKKLPGIDLFASSLSAEIVLDLVGRKQYFTRLHGREGLLPISLVFGIAQVTTGNRKYYSCMRRRSHV